MPQAKNLQKSLAGTIKERSAKLVRAADYPHHITLDQLTQHLARLYAANGFDVGPQYRLAVRDHRQGLHGGAGQPNIDRRSLQSPKPGREFRAGEQLEPPRYILDAKRTAFSIVYTV
jgi:hypothetical protein